MIVSFIGLIGGGLICADSNVYQAQYLAGITFIIIIVINIIFTILSTFKDEDFLKKSGKYQ